MQLSQEKSRILIINYYNFRDEKAEDTDQRIIRNLGDKVERIVHIIHPFPEFKNRYSYLNIFKDGKKIYEKSYYIPNGPAWFQFFFHIFVTYNFLFKTGFRFDLCIAAANSMVLAVLPLRSLNLIKKLVYYSLDFMPQRFSSPLLNNLYHFFSKLACKYVDRNWVMAKEQVEAVKQIGINNSNSAPFSLIPIGYETKKIKILPIEKIDYYQIVYAGALRPNYGPQLAIKTMPLLIKKFPKIRLTIIGKGLYEPELKNMIKKLHMEKYINFRGFVPDFWELTRILSKKSIGLAPYAPMEGSNSYYSDPSKIKLYIVCGLPVITTNVTTMRDTISKNGAGIVIDFSEEELFKAVSDLLNNRKKYQSAKNAVIKLSKKFDINYIMETAIKEIPE